jgi:hypothetical protein
MNYSSLSEEYAKRGRMVDAAGKEFEWTPTIKIKVWNILYGIFLNHPAYQYMRAFKKSKDGPAAYFSLRQHYLGANNVNNMATKLEAEFDSLSYSSETRRWNFEKYVSKHVELYHTAQDLVAYGYAGIDNTSRVRKLLNGIKTDTLDAVRNQVMSDQVLASDFDRVVNLFKDFLVQKKALFKPDNSSAGIAAVSSPKTGINKRKNPRTSSSRNTRRRSSNISAVEVQDRYYTPQEYSQLSQDQKKALHELRKKRSRTAAVASHEDQQEKTMKEESPEEAKSSPMTNRNNPALRQNTPKRNN